MKSWGLIISSIISQIVDLFIYFTQFIYMFIYCLFIYLILNILGFHIKYDYNLPVTQCTKEDVSQNPSCHEADMLHRYFPVITANQVPLQRKTKK